jgi:hypothetical protein
MRITTARARVEPGRRLWLADGRGQADTPLGRQDAGGPIGGPAGGRRDERLKAGLSPRRPVGAVQTHAKWWVDGWTMDSRWVAAGVTPALPCAARARLEAGRRLWLADGRGQADTRWAARMPALPVGTPQVDAGGQEAADVSAARGRVEPGRRLWLVDGQVQADTPLGRQDAGAPSGGARKWTPGGIGRRTFLPRGPGWSPADGCGWLTVGRRRTRRWAGRMPALPVGAPSGGPADGRREAGGGGRFCRAGPGGAR